MAPILAAVDPRAPDPAPARLGALVAGHTGAPLLVGGVYADEEVVDRLVAAQLGEELPGEADAALERVGGELSAGEAAGGGVVLEIATLAIGATSAARGLALAAEEVGAGLLVVGSAAGGPSGRVAVGDTVARLLSGTACAVAVTPVGWEQPARLTTIGVGFVATAEGRVALGEAHALASRAGAVLRVLAAVTPRSWMDVDDMAVLRTPVEEAAEAARAPLLGEPIDVDVEEGEPADVLVAASASLDLLVCGARGYGPRGATLLGGVTRRVVREAACPVVVLARGAEVGLEELIA